MKLWKIAICLLVAVSRLTAQEESESQGMDETSAGGVGIGGIVDIVHTEGNRPSLNGNTLNDNNFNNIRTLLNFNFTHGQKLRADVEVLFDDGADDRVRLQGAFVTLFDLPNEHVNLMIGKLPTPFGNFARREFSDVNPLIGQPLMRQYRTSLDWNNLWTNHGQLILKNRRREFNGNLPTGVLSGAAPMIYDARWDFGVELFGSISIVEYQIAVTEASLSNPDAGQNKGKQFIGRLGVNPAPGLRLGISGARSPYLSNADEQRLLEAGKGLGEYYQTVYGADLEASYRYFMLFSEFAISKWDADVDEKELRNWSWYADVKYKIHPRFYLAARYDMMKFDKIVNPVTGSKETWDFDLQRIEAGIGFRITTDATLKIVEQWTLFDGSADLSAIRFTAVQVSVPF